MSFSMRLVRKLMARRAAKRSGVVSTDPIPPADIARAQRYVRERGWVEPHAQEGDETR